MPADPGAFRWADASQPSPLACEVVEDASAGVRELRVPGGGGAAQGAVGAEGAGGEGQELVGGGVVHGLAAFRSERP